MSKLEPSKVGLASGLLQELQITPASILRDPNALMKPDQAAAQLGITVEQLLKFARDGALKSINVSRGEKKSRYRFDPIDIDASKKARTQEHQPCQSSSRKNPRRSTGTASKSNVVGFTALRAAQLARKASGSKR